MWVRDFGYHPVKCLHFTEVETDAQLYHQVSQSPSHPGSRGGPKLRFFCLLLIPNVCSCSVVNMVGFMK